MAARLGRAGSVANDSAGVVVEIEGQRDSAARFLTALDREAPPLALIERITSREVAPRGATSFAIMSSDRGGERAALVSRDVATCADCLREMFDPADRRFRYPFITCTNCGPRFTIIRDVPHDRATTTI